MRWFTESRVASEPDGKSPRRSCGRPVKASLLRGGTTTHGPAARAMMMPFVELRPAIPQRPTNACSSWRRCLNISAYSKSGQRTARRISKTVSLRCPTLEEAPGANRLWSAAIAPVLKSRMAVFALSQWRTPRAHPTAHHPRHKDRSLLSCSFGRRRTAWHSSSPSLARCLLLDLTHGRPRLAAAPPITARSWTDYEVEWQHFRYRPQHRIRCRHPPKRHGGKPACAG
jgi:hypothetical protein